MRWVVGVVLILLVGWLQLTWFGHVRPLGVMPNLMLITIIMVSLWTNASSAVAAAVGGGWLLDSASGNDFGLRIAFFTALTLAIVATRQLGLQVDSVVTAVGIVILGTVLYGGVVLATIGAHPNGVVMRIMVCEIVVNGCIAFGVWLAKTILEGRRRPIIRASGEFSR